jgi:hypothetical protein
VAPEYHWLKYPVRDGGGATVIPAIAGEALVAGEVVYISGNKILSKADRTDLNKIYAIGVVLANALPGGAVEAQTTGVVPVLFVPGLSLTAGDPVYLDSDGRATNVQPNTPGEALVEIGEIFDASGYMPVGNNYATIAVEVEEPVIIS